MVISSRSVDEMHALLAPMITQHGFEIDRRHAGTFFDQLRLLSGSPSRSLLRHRTSALRYLALR